MIFKYILPFFGIFMHQRMVSFETQKLLILKTSNFSIFFFSCLSF